MNSIIEAQSDYFDNHTPEYQVWTSGIGRDHHTEKSVSWDIKIKDEPRGAWMKKAYSYFGLPLCGPTAQNPFHKFQGR